MYNTHSLVTKFMYLKRQNDIQLEQRVYLI